MKLEKKISFEIENSYGEDAICYGIDEAGRGCLAGPVVASCVWLNRKEFPKELLKEINDSKKLSEKKRERIFKELDELPSNIFMYAYEAINNEIIDEINILQATLLAMKKAYEKLQEKMLYKADIILIDGNKSPLISPCKTIIKGDSLSYSIATASIISKVKKDYLLNEIGKKYPYYEFGKNKGYGTKQHIEALKKYGASPYHRKSYAPVKNYEDTSIREEFSNHKMKVRTEY